ncbi:hypothetical protein FJSC11DRAFT_4325 [Rivularia sp. IAM M-261]|nr:hypothetical protein FJSC11DRAFT_4325 [Calothrix sp. PCC 7716]GJD16526.1 hypothetical protein FJSC11DRAFT_4325 [Rivularia sp. IAM M-261]
MHAEYKNRGIRKMIAKIILSIGVLLASAFLTLVIVQVRNDQEVSRIWQALSTSPDSKNHFTKEMVIELPAPVQRYFLHSIALGTPLASGVNLKMSGNFRLSQDKPWLPMVGEEIISDKKGFVWKAAIGSPLSQMRGSDYYINGLGRMRFSLWGLVPLVNVQNPDTNRSAIGRLAGEMVWLPSGLLPARGVSWKAIDENTIQASLKIDGEPVTLTLFIDSNGKLLKLSFPRWGEHKEDGTYTYILFGGEIQQEQTFAGYTIPSQVSLGWWFAPDRYSEFFRATIEQAKFN